jgi:hypothetical protein
VCSSAPCLHRRRTCHTRSARTGLPSGRTNETWVPSRLTHASGPYRCSDTADGCGVAAAMVAESQGEETGSDGTRTATATVMSASPTNGTPEFSGSAAGGGPDAHSVPRVRDPRDGHRRSQLHCQTTSASPRLIAPCRSEALWFLVRLDSAGSFARDVRVPGGVSSERCARTFPLSGPRAARSAAQRSPDR